METTVFRLGQKGYAQIALLWKPKKTQKNPVGFKNPWVFFETQKPAGFEPCQMPRCPDLNFRKMAVTKNGTPLNL